MALILHVSLSLTSRCLLPAATPTVQLHKNSRWIEVRFHKGDIATGKIDSMLRCSVRV
jgi:hypothetical protein